MHSVTARLDNGILILMFQSSFKLKKKNYNHHYIFNKRYLYPKTQDSMRSTSYQTA